MRKRCAAAETVTQIHQWRASAITRAHIGDHLGAHQQPHWRTSASAGEHLGAHQQPHWRTLVHIGAIAHIGDHKNAERRPVKQRNSISQILQKRQHSDHTCILETPQTKYYKMGEYSSDGFVARIHNEREDITADDILNEADAMWKKVLALNIDVKDQDQVDVAMTNMRREHKEFCTSYPIVMRYMTQFATYARTAFGKYLRRIEQNPWKSEDEYLDSQAEYVVLLYKETHPRWNTTNVQRLHRNIRTMLRDESKTFKDNLDAAEKDVTNNEKRLHSEMKREITEYFRVQLPTEVLPDGGIPASRVFFIED